MTQPDQYFPDTAINASPGFAAYAATTQEEYEQQLRDRTTGIFSGISGLCALLQELPFFGGLAELGAGGDMGDLGQTGNILKGIQDFADAMCGLIIPGSAGDTTPQTVIEGVNSTVETAQASTVYTQLMDLGGAGTGNILLDLLAGIEAFFGAVLGIFTGTGDVTDLLDVLEGIPILGDLVQWITGQQSTGTAAGDGNILSNFFADILSMLGIGGGGDGGGGDPGTGNFDLFDSLLGFLENLIPAGLLTSIIQLPLNLFAGLVPGTSNNVLPTGSAGGAQTSIQGQGHWIWDWPGSSGGNWGSSGGCARTVRTGVITIYWVTGVWEQLVGGTSVHLDIPGYGTPGDPRQKLLDLMSDVTVLEADWLGATSPTITKTIGDNLLDWERFEVIFVPYSGALYPLGYSINEGVATLKGLIRQIPGQFILMGGSLGAAVTSKVFQDIVSPTGSLHHRNDDLLFGWAGASPMRAEGATWPGNPFPVPAGYGCLSETLVTDDPRWWEYSIGAAGSYPAFGRLDGITWDNGDPISCLGDGGLDAEVRTLVESSYGVKQTSANDQNDFFLMLITDSIFMPDASNVLLGIGFDEGASPHGLGWFAIQPFLSQGDTRTMWRWLIEYINDTFGPLVTPAVSGGEQHQLEGIPQTVQPYQVVRASVPVMWCNVVCDGPAIMCAVNAYDADGKIITGPNGETPTVTATDATISNPTGTSVWATLEASFVMPAGAKTAHVVYSVEPEAMATGTVWVDISNATFEVTSLIDAQLLSNMEQFPGIEAHQVGGVQGEANMLTAFQNLLDGVASANSQGSLTGVQLAELFATQGVTAISAAEALTLAIQHERALSVVANEAIYIGLSPSGEATFELQTLPQGDIMPHSTIAQGTALGGFITCKRAASKGFVEFIAEGPGGVSGIYVNVYELNQTTGGLTLQWSSADISASVPQGYYGWVALTIPDADEIVVTSGEIVYAEIVAVGSTVDVVSRWSGVPNKSSIPPNLGGLRTLASTGGSWPATLDASDLTYSDTRPFVCFGVQNIPPQFQPPNYADFNTSALHTFTIPDWAQTPGTVIDAVMLGGGGCGDIAWLWEPGAGGKCGQWVAQSLIYGTDIPEGTTELAAFVGDAGYWNSPEEGANDGQDSILGIAATPAFDAAGAGDSIVSGTNLEWTHTATVGAYVLVYSSWPGTATYDGVSMTQLAAIPGGARVYGLADAPGGAKTVHVTLSADHGDEYGAIANSVSYTGVDSIGTIKRAWAAGDDYVPPTWTLGQLITQGFFSYDTPLSGSTTGGTIRYDGYEPNNEMIGLQVQDWAGPTYFYTIPPVWADGIRIHLLGPAPVTTLLTAAGGAAASRLVQEGQGAGHTAYNGREYFGGGESLQYGQVPGGGGAGAPGWGEYGFMGGRGQIWLTVRQP